MKIGSRNTNQKFDTFLFIILGLVAALVFLPLMHQFNTLITNATIATGFFEKIGKYFVPIQLRVISVVLSMFGVRSSLFTNYLSLDGANPLVIDISWNCLGWQSIIFYILTSLVALQGTMYSNKSKVIVFLIGLFFSYWMNILRISGIVVISIYISQYIGMIMHDYGSTIITIGWLALFWWASFRYWLEPNTQLQ